MSPLSVVLVNQHPADMVGGSEIQCDIIGRELVARGHRVTYVAVGGRTAHDYQTPYPVVPVRRDAQAIAGAVIAATPDIAYWRFNKHCFADAAARIRRAGIPLVFSVSHVRDVSSWYLEPDAWQRGGFRGWRRALKESWRLHREHRGFAFVDALVSNNPDNLGRVPVAIEQHIPNSMLTTAESFTWPRPYCLWVASIKDRKQPEKFIELATRLPDLELDFLMAGPVQSKSYEKLLAAGPAHFHYLGPRRLTEVNGMLAGARFLVHTCLPEGFSNNFIQAWLQRRTVASLAFDPGGLLVREGLGLYAEGDMARFVTDVRRLAETPGLADAMGKKAEDYARMHFSPATNVACLETLFRDVLKRRP